MMLKGIKQQAILREKEVIKVTGLSRSTIRRQEQKGNFPARRILSQKAVGWLESEILDWMESREKGGHDNED